MKLIAEEKNRQKRVILRNPSFTTRICTLKKKKNLIVSNGK